MTDTVNEYSGAKKVINGITIAILAVVAALGPLGGTIDMGEWTLWLKHIYSHTNLLTGFLLIIALVAIKQKKVNAHRWIMLFCTVLGLAFLVMYILHKLSNGDESFDGEGTIYHVYLAILVSHIFMAIFVVRYVLLALFYAMRKDFVKHKKVVKIAYPIWMYVSFTGYVVYAMLEYIG